MNKKEMLINTFGTDKPIIALLHMDPLPGDPLYRNTTSVAKIVDNVKKDVSNLVEGGVDAILFSNA